MLIKWTHFPTFLGAPLSDQDRAAQVASFCTMAPNICESSVHNIFHTTLLTHDILRLASSRLSLIHRTFVSAVTSSS